MAKKGQKYKQWTAEEKYKIIEPIIKLEKSSVQITKETGINNGLITAWVHKYKDKGMEGLISKKKPGNPLSKYQCKKIEGFIPKNEVSRIIKFVPKKRDN